MVYLVGPLIALAGIVALLLVLRTRARTTSRSLYSTAREDRARKVREARELALRSAEPEPEPEPEPQPTTPEPAPTAFQPPPTTPEPAPTAFQPPPTTPEPAPAAYEPPVAPAPEPEREPELEREREPEPEPEPEPAAPRQPAWAAVPQRATNPPAAASTAAVDEPAWLPARTNPPLARRAPGAPAPAPAAAAAAAVDEEEPPAPRMASTIVSYVVLGASLVVILLGIAIMIGMSRG